MPRIPSPEIEARKDLEEIFDNGRMTCAHCGQSAMPVKIFAASARSSDFTSVVLGVEQEKPSYTMSVAVCAACGDDNIFVKRWYRAYHITGDSEEHTVWHKRLFPVGRAAKSLPNSPAEHLKSYQAACQTLEASPEASACMSRRCLQGILRAKGYMQRDLVKQIEAVLAETDPEKVLPSELQKTVDFVRTFGNLGAHPKNNAVTLEVIDVEPDEAEWCIEIAEQLMDHYFERPALIKAKIDAANQKRQAAGRRS